MAVNIVKDELSFPQADNPIVQFKDAMTIQNNITDFNSREDLATILDGSLFRLSVQESASSRNELLNQMLMIANDNPIKWVETIKYNIEHINLDDPKDFNDLKNCCDDLIDPIQNPNVNDNSYENWKMPE